MSTQAYDCPDCDGVGERFDLADPAHPDDIMACCRCGGCGEICEVCEVGIEDCECEFRVATA